MALAQQNSAGTQKHSSKQPSHAQLSQHQMIAQASQSKKGITESSIENTNTTLSDDGLSDYSSSVNTTQSKIVHEHQANRKVDEALNNMEYD